MDGLGKDSCMVCYDGLYLGLLVDDDIFNILSTMNSDKYLYGFADSCNSGTLFDLPYINVANYTNTFNTNIISSLLNQFNNCTIISSDFPSKINKTKGNIIFISGTRDSSYSYEVSINNTPCGLFTYNLCKILDYGASNLSLKNFYYLIIACINKLDQIPVLTTSQNINLDTYKMDVLLYKPIIIPPKIQNTSILHKINENRNKLHKNKKVRF